MRLPESLMTSFRWLHDLKGMNDDFARHDETYAIAGFLKFYCENAAK
jgi:hypothetical protein